MNTLNEPISGITPQEVIKASQVAIETAVEKKSILAPLPFTYERINDPKLAQFQEWRVSPVSFVDEENLQRTDEEIVKMIKKEREGKDWFTSEYWRSKGIPQEQIELQINGRAITIYNYNKKKPFTDEHIQRAQRVFQEIAAHFPQILQQIRWILIDDIQQPSMFGDPEKYPLNGYALTGWQAFRLLPRGMDLIPHRVSATSNFEGTIAHETTHLIQKDFEPEWRGKFKWDYCSDYPNDWEVRPTPNGEEQRFFNKTTGEMSPQGQFPLQPDQCITYYSKQNMGEDIADSMVAYIYDPDGLRKISEDKYNILRSHDAKQPTSTTSAKRIPSEEIHLPEVKPETVYYYIKEPVAQP